MTVRLDRKEGVAQLVCRVCDQRYQSKVNRKCIVDLSFHLRPSAHALSDLTEPIDIYSEWIDAADAAQREEQIARRPVASSSRPVPPLASVEDSDDE